MSRARFSSVLASAILVLGSSAIAMAQGGPPDDVEEVRDLELQDETATNRVRNQDDEFETDNGDGDGDAGTVFSRWVRDLPLTGCQRGQTIAKYARQGPHEFDPVNNVEPVPVDELPGNCAQGGDGAGDDAPANGNGPPAHSGRPDHAGQPGPPPHAGQPGPPPHARGGGD